MNPRKFGKILIILGILMILVYGAWIVFRVVKKPDEVARDGLLPNPFDISVPALRPATTEPTNAVVSVISETPTVRDIPDEPAKKLFRISSLPALGFTTFQVTQKAERSNPLTGLSETYDAIATKIRYVTRDEGNVVDSVLLNNTLTEQKISTAFFSGLVKVGVGRYGVVGQYLVDGSQNMISYFQSIERPQIKKTEKPECSVELVAIKYGETGRNVETMQSFLAKIVSSSELEIVPGKFDDATKQLVQKYQKQKNISPVSGIVGKKTLESLQKTCLEVAPKEQVPETIEERLSRDQQSVSLLPRGTYFATMLSDTKAFIMQNSKGKNRAIVKDIMTGSDTEVYSLGFIEWIPKLLNDTTILMTTRASGSALGYAFRLDTNNKTMDVVIHGETGLATLPSPTGSKILYSSTEGGLPTLQVIDSLTGEPTSIELATFAEKCAWTKNEYYIYCFVPTNLSTAATYPDEWYKRGTITSDVLYRIDVVGGYRVDRVDPSDEISAIKSDVINVQIVDDSSILVFRDWRTGYVWGYKIQ